MTRLLVCEGPCTPPATLAAYEEEAQAFWRELNMPERTRGVQPSDRVRLMTAARGLVHTPHRAMVYEADRFECMGCGTQRQYGRTDGLAG